MPEVDENDSEPPTDQKSPEEYDRDDPKDLVDQ
jgi:hypothetical protein